MTLINIIAYRMPQNNAYTYAKAKPRLFITVMFVFWNFILFYFNIRHFIIKIHTSLRNIPASLQLRSDIGIQDDEDESSSNHKNRGTFLSTSLIPTWRRALFMSAVKATLFVLNLNSKSKMLGLNEGPLHRQSFMDTPILCSEESNTTHIFVFVVALSCRMTAWWGKYHISSVSESWTSSTKSIALYSIMAAW